MNRVVKVKFKEYDDYTDGDINDKSFIEELISFDWLVYSYATGCYCGTGVCVYKKDGKFYQNNLGHCSCYGPTEDLEAVNGFPTLEDLIKNCSDGLKDEMVEVIKKIKILKLK